MHLVSEQVMYVALAIVIMSFQALLIWTAVLLKERIKNAALQSVQFLCPTYPIPYGWIVIVVEIGSICFGRLKKPTEKFCCSFCL